MRQARKQRDASSYINRMVERIVQKFDPEQIILFGSQARGNAHPGSDVDLLVVMPVKGSVFEKGLDICESLHGIPFPVDIVVTTPEEFAWRKGFVGTIEWPATTEGKVLYVRTRPGHDASSRVDRQGRK